MNASEKGREDRLPALRLPPSESDEPMEVNMAQVPTDPKEAIGSLAQAIDSLSGQVAALTAFVAYTTELPLGDKDVKSIDAHAQRLVPTQLAPPGSTTPTQATSRAVEKLVSMAKSFHAIRSAGPRT